MGPMDKIYTPPLSLYFVKLTKNVASALTIYYTGKLPIEYRYHHKRMCIIVNILQDIIHKH